MRYDAKKCFYQVRARKRQHQIMRFWHPVKRELYQFVTMTMGVSGASRVAALLTGSIAQLVQSLGVSAFHYCDEILTQNASPTLAYLSQYLLIGGALPGVVDQLREIGSVSANTGKDVRRGLVFNTSTPGSSEPGGFTHPEGQGGCDAGES